MFSKIYLIHTIYVYKSFLTALGKGLRKNIKKRWEIGKRKWNMNTEYEIEKVKQSR